MYKQSRSRSVILFFLLISFVLSATCMASDDIKSRMKARLPALATLKSQGVIGENSQGYLEFRKADKSQEALIKEENEDRSKVYTAIAKQQGADATLVGSRRALQIAGQADAGTWLQKPDGTWYQK
ncbi:MAG: YdbL family protein [Proteobacteria bacterium]|nr:YdbL family protein [Pseudomonadota bacterium]MBU4296868.1 YdbL family protein [Pseudomonadota bacterium]MCG2746506.1 YdbL family protein [Desulfobulbaceae bacterium]